MMKTIPEKFTTGKKPEGLQVRTVLVSDIIPVQKHLAEGNEGWMSRQPKLFTTGNELQGFRCKLCEVVGLHDIGMRNTFIFDKVAKIINIKGKSMEF